MSIKEQLLAELESERYIPRSSPDAYVILNTERLSHRLNCSRSSVSRALRQLLAGGYRLSISTSFGRRYVLKPKETL